jgi:toxin-antitoxin system PIN domain toxin
LDVNVLIALVDGAHINHEAAHRWIGTERPWATCPLTQNGFARILSNPAYPTITASPADVVEALRQLVASPRHLEIWDDVSLADEALFDPSALASSRQVTDTYLLGLAHRHGLGLATFDRKIRHEAVVGASPTSVTLISA